MQMWRRLCQHFQNEHHRAYLVSFAIVFAVVFVAGVILYSSDNSVVTPAVLLLVMFAFVLLAKVITRSSALLLRRRYLTSQHQLLFLLLSSEMEDYQQLEEADVDSRGATDEQIQNLNVSVSADDGICVICLNPFEEGEQIISLPCNHVFHSDELISWLRIKATCPTCISPVV
jgi:SUMO ligase MMS21 Smc5/6 complex component